MILKDLISKEEVIQSANLRKYRLAWAADFLMNILGATAINKFYSAIPTEPEGLSFLETAMKNLKVHFPVPEQDWQNIPKEGAFITVSNHPFGFLDGILLLITIGKIRPDFKVMANAWLKRMPPIADVFIPVDPNESKQQSTNSLAGTKLTLQQLRNGHPVGIFPAGEVSTYQSKLLVRGGKSAQLVQDRNWQPAAMKIIRKSKVPVVPVFFQGQNSYLFHLFGKIHPYLRTLRIPLEFMQKEGKTIPIRIGEPISVEKQNEFGTLEGLADFLKAQTYSLGK
ncbi:MAG: hypothetical protein EAZ08_02780 [Cytophagales bacterium]|nr:MAG: hypothetical protein EAZ08_02780 [Cytophagales bacterium]